METQATENKTATDLRASAQQQAKALKAAWVPFAQVLYSVWRDNLYYAWGFEDFESYVESELGMKKSAVMKMVKNYFFVEQCEPQYIQSVENHDLMIASEVPGVDALDVLRRARAHKDIKREDYVQLRKKVFDKGKHEGIVAKELTTIIKERKQVDPVEEREKRAEKSIKNTIGALRSFNKEMDILKAVPEDIVKESENLVRQLIHRAE